MRVFLLISLILLLSTSTTLADHGLITQLKNFYIQNSTILQLADLNSLKPNKIEKISKKTQPARSKQNVLQNIKREITVLQKNNRLIGENHYNQLLKKLITLEKNRSNFDEIKSLKKILATLLPKKSGEFTGQYQKGSSESGSMVQIIKDEIKGIQGKKLSDSHYLRLKKELDFLTSQGIKELESYYEIIEKANPLATKQTDQEQVQRLQELEEKNRKKGQITCDPNAPVPIFTEHITDPEKIGKISAPGIPTNDKDIFKGHGFIWPKEGQVSSEGMPVYAPVDAYLIDEGYGPEYNVLQYGLDFATAVNANFRFRIHHLIIVSNKFSQEAAIEKISEENGNKIFVKAGELIGYGRNPVAKNWDFGLYNLCSDGPLAKFNAFGLNRYAVCWVDYFQEPKKSFYRSLLTGDKLICNF